MDRLALIRERAEAYRASHPVRFAVLGPGDLVTRHRFVHTATAANTRRQARVVVRLDDSEPMTVSRSGRITERQVDRMVKRLERAKPVELDVEELPDADAAGEGEDAA